MNFVKRLVCVLLAVCLISGLPVSAEAAEDVSPYIQRMIQYYLHYQDKADTEIETLLEYISSEDPGQGTLWRAIMEDWAWSNEEMRISRDVLPDGLPQDDSMCIVVLGYGLNSDGSMREELVDRLVVALASALKYPNAYVCVTGGATASNSGNTEAGQMAAWLVEKGLDTNRIIMETGSYSTHENAMNVYNILNREYPQVDSVAIVTSDYHLSWGVSMFTTVSHYKSYYGGNAIKVVGNAANTTSKTSQTYYSQAWGICVITDTPFNGSAVPAMYAEATTAATLPTAEPAVEAEEQDGSWLAFPAVMIGLAVVILLIPTRKRGRKR